MLSFRAIYRRLRERVLALFWIRAQAGSSLQPIRQRRSSRPSIRSLEERIVLNATAELNALGQLVVASDSASDTITLDLQPSGDLLVTDGANNIVPIANHPSSTTSPLSTTAISSGQIVIDLGDGNDTLNLEVVDGLDVSVVGGAGNDQVNLQYVTPAVQPSNDQIAIESEAITIGNGNNSFATSNDQLTLTGRLIVGDPSVNSNIDIGTGSLLVDGVVDLQGSVSIFAAGGSVDFSGAVTTASTPNTNLFFRLSDPVASNLSLGQVNASGGESIENLIVVSASTFSATQSIEVGGGFFTQGVVGPIQINDSIVAQTIQVRGSDQIDVFAPLTTQDGQVSISSSGTIRIAESIDTSAGGLGGSIVLVGSRIELIGADLSTDGADIDLIGSSVIDQTVELNSNSNPTGTAGNIRFLGTVTGQDETDDDLTVLAAGDNGGAIQFLSSIGDSNSAPNVFNLSSLTVEGSSVETRDFLVAGPVAITAPSIRTFGSQWTANTLDLNGPLLLPVGDLNIETANALNFNGNVTGQSGSNRLSVNSGGSVNALGAIGDFNNLQIVSVEETVFNQDLNVLDDVAVSANEIQIVTSSIRAGGQLDFQSPTDFQADTNVSADAIRFGGSVNTIQGVSVSIQGPIVQADPLQKIGAGTLRLQAANLYAGSTDATAGTLVVNGSIGPAAGPVTVDSDARLEGSGSILTSVVVRRDGTIAPGEQAGDNEGVLQVQSLELQPGSILETDIAGLVAGPDTDQLIITPSANSTTPFVFEGASLDLNLTSNPLPATEFIIVRNDGTAHVEETLRVGFAVDGTPLATPRALAEGDLVLAPFGSESTSAFITYFGGDGNDIAIVTSGDVRVPSAGVTIISRLGTDIHVRTGASFAEAEVATPTIRPIAGLQNNELLIPGTTDSDSVFLDVNAFVDTSANAVNFNGNIRVVGNEGFGETDRFVFFDSDLGSDDTPDGLRYVFSDLESTVVQYDSPGVAEDFTIQLEQIEAIDQTIEAPVLSIEFSNAGEVIVIDSDPSVSDRTRVVASTNIDRGTSLSFVNPTESLILETSGGDDAVTLDGFGSSNGGLVSGVRIDGQQGVDSFRLSAPLRLGSGSTTGNLDLAAEAVVISANVDTTRGNQDGNVLIQSLESLTVDSAATISVGSGAIQLDGGGGLIDTNNASLFSENTGDAVFIHNADTVELGNIEATEGSLRIGQIQNVTGQVSQSLLSSINVDQFTASTAGALDLSNEANQIRLVADVLTGGEVRIADNDLDLTVSSLVSSGNDVVIQSQQSILLTNAAINATGANIRLIADSGITDIDVDDGQVNLRASSLDLIAGGLGIGQVGNNNVDLVATERLNATTSGFGGDIQVASPQEIPLGRIDARRANIQLIASSVEDADLDQLADLISNQVEIAVENGIGVARRIELGDVQELTATTEQGGIQADWFASDPTVIRQATAQSGDININQSGKQRLDIQLLQNDAGSIQITNLDQSIEVLGATNFTNSITAGDQGSIQLTAFGNQSDIRVRSGITSELGEIRVLADRNIAFSEAGDITSAFGDISINADQRSGNFGGAVSMSDGTVVDAGDGVISVLADGNVDLGSLVTKSASDGAVVVTSQSSEVTDRGDQGTDIDVNFGTATITAARGIGVADPIDTSIAILNASATQTGGIRFSETDAIELSDVKTNDGVIRIDAGGSITAVRVESSNVDGFDDVSGDDGPDTRDIHLTAVGSQSDVLVGAITADRGADVFLTADDDLLDQTGTGRLIQADDVRLVAFNMTADQVQSIDLSTNINDLEAFTVGPNRGDIEIRETDSINLAASDRVDDSEMLRTDNGEIRVLAGQSVGVSDPDTTNETPSLFADPEIVAGGDNGRIRIESGTTLELQDAVQIHASQSSIDAVLLESDEIVLGENIEINTGVGIGIARIFSPRPDVDLKDTAFYESTTVSTNILEQAAINDAEGKLTVDIGNPGERGLTINIDWGAETGRFQQIDGLSGDAPPLVVSHVYLEEDILESRLNDRESETKPLNVKFSVRHHESIRVIGSSVTQDGGDVETVPGLVVSSTDNPLTAQSEQIQILENGTASFIIPSLTIPVAFFPVRDVIPILDEPEVFVKTEQNVELASVDFETTTTSVSSSISRDEFFQIRILSPDPDGDDLSEPERLPDDILDGDKLQELFAELPDGRYEVQYVLGDGNERSILRVDLRDGRPVVPSDDLDEGTLRLRPIDNDSNPVIESEQETQADTSDEATDSNTKSVGNSIPKHQPQSSTAYVADTEVEPIQSETAFGVAGAALIGKRQGSGGRNPFSIAARFAGKTKRNQSA